MLTAEQQVNVPALIQEGIEQLKELTQLEIKILRVRGPKCTSTPEQIVKCGAPHPWHNDVVKGATDKNKQIIR